MGNRSFFPLEGTLGQQKTVVLFLKWTGAGAASATLTADQKAKGVASVTYLSSTGKFRIALQENYQEFLGLQGTVLDASAGQQSKIEVEATSLTASGGSTIDIAIYSSASGAALALYNPASGTETVYCQLYLGKSAVNTSAV